MSRGLLEVRGIVKTLPAVDPASPAVRIIGGVSFSVASGELVSLLGPSGCGKTTLLKIVAGLVRADEGEVRLDGIRTEGVSRNRGFVFQNFGLLPWRTVLANVEFALELHQVAPERRRGLAQEYLRLVGLRGFEEHYPHQISGGMQQRVGIARALAIDPAVLLMDEPFSAVDAQTREDLQNELLKLLSDRSVPTIFVTHSIEEALYLSDRVLVFTQRPAQVLKDICVDLPKPRWSFDVQADAQFLELRRELREMLRGDNG
jgi:NitT/TauT family transport system ATP-binding protein